MPDDPNKTGKEDDIRINISQPHEVKYWTGRIGCTEQQLRDAVAAVGPMVKNVRGYLGK